MKHARRLGLLTAAALLVTCSLSATSFAAGQFTFLQPPFTQELYGTQSAFMGGVAFAPDGDPITNNCSFSGSPLHRFDSASTLPPLNGTSTLHPRTDMSSNAGCGLTQVGGVLFSNLSSGVIKLDPDTGATLAGPAGPGGNALGIAVDPASQDLVYVGSNGTLHRINQALTSTSVFSTALTGNFLDGIYFDPTGDFLFAANRSGAGAYSLAIIDSSNGALVQHVPMSTEPDGIAFKASPPKFVVSGNLDGTMTRFDFPGDDYTQPATQSVFASGGFRSDLSQVGSDGCLYQSQAGTRYDDGTTTGDNSLVRICPGFAPPAGVEGPPGALTCSNGIDDDGDGQTDQSDPDCQSPEGPPGNPSCSDGIDNDGDGQTDASDTGCQSGPPGNPLCFGQQATIVGNGTVTGTNNDDVIVTGNGADVVDGRGGNDRICTHGGGDFVRAGSGDDRVSGGNGNDNLGGQSGNDLIQGVNGDDDIQGEKDDDTMRGGSGDDDVNGGDGADRLFGEDDSDTLAGGGGAPDSCDGGAGSDNLAASHGCESVSNVP